VRGFRYFWLMKNTGKSSETIFENSHKMLGKKAFVWRIPDAAEIYGRTGGGRFNRSMPCDYLITVSGKTEYAEVKSTQNLTSFPFNLLKKDQIASAAMIVAAGGSYFIYVHHLISDRWYRIPFALVQAARELGSSSIKWPELEEYSWNP
jgi:penicillin-binding protein-related factor A (putative recombinase)